MTLLRLIPVHINAVLETILAPVVIVAPFAFGFSASALVASVVLGVLMMGTALSTSAALAGEGGGSRVSAHADVDLGLALSAALAGLVFATGGDVAAAGLFLVAAAAQGLLAATTRYSARA